MIARTKEELVPILFRYFMAADLMSQEFDEHLTRDPNDSALHDGNPMAFLVSKAGLKMCLWYAMLYVVVDGWRLCKLSDPEVDELLKSPNVKLLKQFRDGMFHFQPGQWLPKKLSGFFEPKNKTVEWVRALTTDLRRSLLAEMKNITAKA
jgi:hypothetical protein